LHLRSFTISTTSRDAIFSYYQTLKGEKEKQSH
jgi:hypothetical protein